MRWQARIRRETRLPSTVGGRELPRQTRLDGPAGKAALASEAV